MVPRFLTILAVCGLLTLGGCSDHQSKRMDELADNVNQALPIAQDLVNSPIGDTIGEKPKGYLNIGLIAIGAAAAAWQTYRKNQIGNALGSVVIGIENSAKESAEMKESVRTVKQNILEVMRGDGAVKAQNKIIDKAKA